MLARLRVEAQLEPLSATKGNVRSRNCPQRGVPHGKPQLAPVPFWFVPCRGHQIGDEGARNALSTPNGREERH